MMMYALRGIKDEKKNKFIGREVIMKSIRVKNLRSLKDTNEIEIKKLNVLVGSNSSGKSTFLRIFPLLKQSFNKKINGPILWCGDDDDYVDFGSFGEAVNYAEKEKCIKLAFNCKMDLESDGYRIRPIRNKKHLEDVKVEFSIKNNKTSFYDYISQIIFEIKNKIVIVNFSEKNEIESVQIESEQININEDDNGFFTYFYEQSLFGISLVAIRQYVEKKIKTLFKVSEESERRTVEDYISYIYYSKMFHEDVKVSNKVKADIENTYELYKKQFEHWVLLYNLPEYFYVITNYIRTYFRKVYYIAPVRATAERYYTLRNIAVNEVDCRGKNLAVFLNSLPSKKFTQFQTWTRENLGFEIIKATSEGHVSLKVKRKNQEKPVNLSDTGFGYSQLLPIVTQLWYIAEEAEEERTLPFRINDFNLPTTIVIEQPELHLHPALQAKLIDIMAKVAQQGQINFIIETHSETMINRIGYIIAKGGISNDDVGITIFEKEIGDNCTLVKQGGYDKEGYLENWPIGFFEPEEE